ncbi:hypothetical protein OE88DRAFT_177988 [Heliocybe sulcata]|uniref:Uncharacterized protein n=1 Tax=Heliocybe sulcata TaxID=5364 RepID=A0A5C3N3W4_9AGAM|nr:hypothetical protein OE88DRAFT_177988 [Heliocybe sulcata]
MQSGQLVLSSRTLRLPVSRGMCMSTESQYASDPLQACTPGSVASDRGYVTVLLLPPCLALWSSFAGMDRGVGVDVFVQINPLRSIAAVKLTYPQTTLRVPKPALRPCESRVVPPCYTDRRPSHAPCPPGNHPVFNSNTPSHEHCPSVSGYQTTCWTAPPCFARYDRPIVPTFKKHREVG